MPSFSTELPHAHRAWQYVVDVPERAEMNRRIKAGFSFFSACEFEQRARACSHGVSIRLATFL